MGSDKGGIRLGKTLSFSWEIFVDNLASLLVLASMPMLPSFLLQAFLSPGNIHAHGMHMSLWMVLLLNAFAVVSIVLSMCSYLATAVVVEKSVLGQDASLAEALDRAFPRLPVAVGTILLAMLIITGWTLLLIIPGMIWGLYYVFISESVCLRGLGFMAALRYSKNLVKGNWWNVWLILFVSVVAAMVPAAVPTVLARFFLGKGLLAGAVQMVLFTFATAFCSTVRVVLFLALECLRGHGIASPKAEPAALGRADGLVEPA